MNLAWLLEAADLTCARCGRKGVTTFTDLEGLGAFLSPELRNGFAQLDPAGLQAFGPVHQVCPRDRPVKPCPYRLERSVG